MQPLTTLVLALNGPRRRADGKIQHHRIHAACKLAQNSHPLLIVGDANGGNDIAAHEAYARSLNVETIFTAHHPDGRTITDIRAAIAFLTERLTESHELYVRITTIYLVTDHWHMERALAMLEGELSLSRGPDHGYTIVPHPVYGGESPTEEMLHGERRGLHDYRSGTYGPSPFAPVGKPKPRPDLHLPSPSRDEDQHPAISGS